MLVQKLLSIAQVSGQAVLYILLALSVVSIGIIIERLVYFARRRIDAASVGPQGGRLSARGRRRRRARLSVDAARRRGRGRRATRSAGTPTAPTPSSEVLAGGTKERRKGYESGLLFLGTLGNNAPFVGLFGTVLGIVTAFRELAGAAGNAAGMNNVMSGIAEALVATAVGILVALPAVIAYNVFQKKTPGPRGERAVDRQPGPGADEEHQDGFHTAFAPARAATRRHARGGLAMAGTLGGGGGRRGDRSRGINVTPLVDVVLVLLIILMVSSTYIVAQSLKVQLPKSHATDGTADKPATVTLLKTGRPALERSRTPARRRSRAS